MKALIDYERFGLPVRRGANLFYTWNSGLMNQSQLLVRPVDAAVGTKGRVLLDPNTWAKDGATALDAWAPSDDGRLLAYSVQDGGSDWRTVKFATVADGKPLADELKWVKFSGLAWLGNDAVLYSRFAEPKPGQAFQALNYNQTVWMHHLGTPQSADQMVFATPDLPKRGHGASVSSDGRWVVISSSEGTDPVNTVTSPASAMARSARWSRWFPTSRRSGTSSMGWAISSGSFQAKTRRSRRSCGWICLARRPGSTPWCLKARTTWNRSALPATACLRATSTMPGARCWPSRWMAPPPGPWPCRASAVHRA
jgi:prolyl oligopeptidase PreP (S9A serine peptidase family)